MERLSDGVLIGVTSYVTITEGEEKPCTVTTNPSVYAKVAWARDWIKQIAKV
jgi:hypothetical protein